MGNRCPDETKRLEAINNEVRNINTVYDIETARRKIEASIVPDGTVYKFSALVNSSGTSVLTDDDVKKIEDIYRTDDEYGNEYVWVEPEEFFRNVRAGINEDRYTTYFENGYMYLAINSINGEATATDFTIAYYSTFLALNGTTFTASIAADTDYTILLPSRFKDLVVLGSMKRLFWPAIGEDGNNQISIISNRYKAELTKLGLDTNAKPLKKTIRKVKLRPPVGVTTLGSGRIVAATDTGSVNAEEPIGAVNGINTIFDLAHTPTLLIGVVNGVVQEQDVKYSLSGATITFFGAYTPQVGDTIRASYNY
jgi:hypothetical protein